MKQDLAEPLQVQTGDIVDRGPDTQKLYRWMRQLTEQAAGQGGKVVKLWGYVVESTITLLHLMWTLVTTSL